MCVCVSLNTSCVILSANIIFAWCCFLVFAWLLWLVWEMNEVCSWQQSAANLPGMIYMPGRFVHHSQVHHLSSQMISLTWQTEWFMALVRDRLILWPNCRFHFFAPSPLNSSFKLSIDSIHFFACCRCLHLVWTVCLSCWKWMKIVMVWDTWANSSPQSLQTCQSQEWEER